MAPSVCRRLALLAIALLLAGCASLVGPVENPQISVVSLRVLPAQGAEQRIEVGLRVLNPNSFDLHAQGLVIALTLNEVPVLKGATPDLPVVPAYGEAQATVTVSLSLLNGVRFVNSLMQNPDRPLQYRLEARLDLADPPWRRLTMMRQGEISPRPPGAHTE